MKNKWFIIIGSLALVVIIACAVLGFGENAYRSSNGQRGWSLGATVYNALGWGADAYRADTTQHMQRRMGSQGQPGNNNGVQAAPNGAPNAAPDKPQFPGRGFGQAGFQRGQFGRPGGGLGHGLLILIILVALGVGGFFLYRRWKKNRAAKTEA